MRVPSGRQPDQLSSEESDGFCAEQATLPEHEDGMTRLFQGRRVTPTQSSVKAFSKGWIRANE